MAINLKGELISKKRELSFLMKRYGLKATIPLGKSSSARAEALTEM